MTIPYYNILDISQFSLMTIRHRHTDGISRFIVHIIAEILAIFLVTLSLISLTEMNGNVEHMVHVFEPITTFSQVFVKLIPLMVYNNELKQLHNAMNLFWDIEDFPELVPKFKKIYKNSFIAFMCYQIVMLSTLFLFIGQSYIKYELSMVTYVPTQIPYAFEIVMFSQYITGTIINQAMTGFDLQFPAFLKHLLVQMKCLNYALRNIDMQSPSFSQTLKKYVQYHRFLLNFFQNLLRIAGVSMMVQYVTSTLLLCMQLFMLSDNLESPSVLIQHSCYTSGILIQFALYCFPVTEFTIEAELFSDSVYSSNWYEGTPSQQKTLGFIILRGQREVHFVAAGLAEINRQAFLTVIKTAVSYFTIMKQFQRD